MGFYQRLLRPILFRLDAEKAHHLAAAAIPFAKFVPGLIDSAPTEGDALRASLFGKEIINPVGLAAGFDKNGQFTEYLADFGFGFAEIGSITGRASQGNPKPRLFRLPADEAVINRMGLNGDGANVVAERLRKAKFSLPVAVNIAKTNDPTIVGDAAIADQLSAFEAVHELPLLYVAINASCPNTHEGCLKANEELDSLLQAFQSANTQKLPLLLKLSPDSTDELLEQFVAVAAKHKLRGFICGNTTVAREWLKTEAATVSSLGNGGLSGKPLRERALHLVRRVYKMKAHDQEIIGCGGISSGADALRFIRAGASTIQLYTAMVYQGANVVNNVNRELAKLLAESELTLQQAIGSEKMTASR